MFGVSIERAVAAEVGEAGVVEQDHDDVRAPACRPGTAGGRAGSGHQASLSSTRRSMRPPNPGSPDWFHGPNANN